MRSPSTVDHTRQADGYPALPRKTRLPFPASDRVLRNTVTVTDPSDIFTLSQQERERDLHILIRRYVNQILYGCQDPLCTAPTCLSYQRRVAKSPLRRYTPLSARTLACFLVSEKDPEAGLCPNALAVPLDIISQSASTKRTRKHDQPYGRESDSKLETHLNGSASVQPEKQTRHPGLEARRSRINNKAHKEHATRHFRNEHPVEPSAGYEPRREVSSVASKKDPKSFTQNVFDTLALRMLEWVPLRQRQRPNNDAPTLDHDGATDQHDSETVSHGQRTLSRSTSNAEDTLLKGSGDGHITSDPEHQKKGSKILNKSSDVVQLPSLSFTSVEKPKQPKMQNGHSHHGSRTRRVTPSRRISTRSFDVPLEASLATDDVPPITPSSQTHDNNISSNPARPAKVPILGSRREQVANLRDIGTLSQIPMDTDNPSSDDTAAFETPSLATLSELFLEDLREMVETHQGKSQARLKLTNAILSHSVYQAVLHPSVELEYFIRQSLFFVLKSPSRLMQSFNLHLATIDGLNAESIFYSLGIMYDLRPCEELTRHLWHTLHDLHTPIKDNLHLLQRHRRRKSSSLSIGQITESDATTTDSFPNDSDAATICAFATYALARMVLPSTIVETEHAVDMANWNMLVSMRSGGSVVSRNHPAGYPKIEEGYQKVIETAEIFDNEDFQRVVEQLVAIITNRLALYEISKSRTGKGKHLHTKATRPSTILQSMFKHLALFRDVQHKFLAYERNFASSALLAWIRTLFLKEWDGKPITRRTSNVGGVIQILAAMFEDKVSLGLDPDDFYTPLLYERLDPMEMPLEWLSFRTNNKTMHLLSYSFLFPAKAVVTYFRAINFATMSKSFETAMGNSRHVQRMAFECSEHIPIHNDLQIVSRLRPAMATYLVLEVRRDNVLTDAIDHLWRREKRELMSPLKVRMGMEEGEEGIDHGGVQQEFFRVLFGEALDPDYGMFTVDSRTRMTWFQPGSLEQLYKFEMLGVLMSLAVYNSVTLPITFPLAFYRKLLGLKVKKLDHIRDGWPELTRGLEDLLEWQEGDVGDIFLRTYEFSYEIYGQPVSVDMQKIGRDATWPPNTRSKGKGKAKQTSFDFSSTSPRALQTLRSTAQSEDDDILAPSSSHPPNLPTKPSTSSTEEAALVTNANRTQYVKDYIFWLLHKSISPQYEAFARGFYTCLDRTALSIFTPDALKVLVEGHQDLDIDGLHAATKYEDGFSESHRVIQDFWEIVKSWEPQKQKSLLEFVTASDRVPVNGVKSVMFVIQRNGFDDVRLPTSLTCFGRLLLPQYSSKEVLEERLEKAVENSRGFGVA